GRSMANTRPEKRSNAWARLCVRCHRSATCTAPGAPRRAALAYTPSRSRQITSAPACSPSQPTNASAEGSSNISTTRCASASTRIVWNQKSRFSPGVCPHGLWIGMSRSWWRTCVCWTQGGQRDEACRLGQLLRGRTSWSWHVGKALQQVIDRMGSFDDCGSLVIRQSDLGKHPLQVALGLEELCFGGILWHVEVAARASHPMRALFEEAVRTQTVTQVKVLPWSPRRGGAAGDRVSVDEHLDGPDVASEIAGVVVGLGQRGRRNPGVVLSRFG